MPEKKKQSLEQEFIERMDAHKICTITTALTFYGKDGIYDSPLLRDFRDETGDRSEKANKITDVLWEEMQNGDYSRTNPIYDLCWDYLKNDINDQRAYMLDEDEEENQKKQNQDS